MTMHPQRAVARTKLERGVAFTAGGSAVSYIAQGQGPDVVLIHGAYLNALDFQVAGLVQALADAGFRALAVDRPAHGHSAKANFPTITPAAQVAHLRSALKDHLHRPIIVGHSLGGAIALTWALRAPDAVTGVVTLAGATHPWGGGDETWYVKLGAHPVLGPVFAHSLVPTVGPFFIQHAAGSGFAPAEPPPDYAKQVKLKLAVRPHDFRATSREIAALDASLREQAPYYADLACPVRALTAPEDVIVPPSIHAFQLAEATSHGTCVVLPGAGHMLHHADPDAVVRAVRDVHQEALSLPDPHRPVVAEDSRTG